MQKPTRKQPTYHTSPQQFQHEQDKVRGNEHRGSRNTQPEFPYETEKMSHDDPWFSH